MVIENRSNINIGVLYIRCKITFSDVKNILKRHCTFLQSTGTYKADNVNFLNSLRIFCYTNNGGVFNDIGTIVYDFKVIEIK